MKKCICQIFFISVFLINSVSAQKFYFDTITAPDSIKVYTYNNQFTRGLNHIEIESIQTIRCRIPEYIDISVKPIDISFSSDTSCSEDLSNLLIYLMFINTNIINDTLIVSLLGNELFSGIIEDNYLTINYYIYRLVIMEQDVVKEQVFTSYTPLEYDTMLYHLNSPGDTLEVSHFEVLFSVVTPLGKNENPIDINKKIEQISEFNIFPIPVKTVATINLPFNATLNIFDLQGKQVLTKLLHQGVNKLNLENLSQGIYYFIYFQDETKFPLNQIIIKE